MTDIHHQPTPSERPFSLTSFQGKLDKFQQFIAEVTLQDTDASPEEKRQAVNGEMLATCAR